MEITSHSFKDRCNCEKCELETNVIQKQKVANRLNTIKYISGNVVVPLTTRKLDQNETILFQPLAHRQQCAVTPDMKELNQANRVPAFS